MEQRFWRTRREWTRSVHGHLRIGPIQLGYHAHLHHYPIQRDYRLVLQPQFTVDFGR